MKILTVYNTCGIHRDSTSWYIKCINSILDQDYNNNRVAISSCQNSPTCLADLKQEFGDRVDLYHFPDRYIVNTTFNKTVQECIKKYGEFDAYLFLDSGIVMEEKSAISKGVEALKTNLYSMVSFQTDTDTGLQPLGFLQDSEVAQIVDEDFVMPVGGACNLHAQFFTHDIYESFNSKVVPDVFAAYCTESTFSFINASIKKNWAILKDIVLKHNKNVDGASAGYSHVSNKFRNPWNNLLYDRNATDFINDPEAIEYGLGYEECGNVMLHNPDAYTKAGKARHPKKLKDLIVKYFYSCDSDLNYDDIISNPIPENYVVHENGDITYKDISFLLPTNRDVQEYASKVIDNINHLHFNGKSYEIITVSPEEIKGDNVLSLIEPSPNRGSAIAYNEAYEASSGRYIVLCTDDHVFDKEAPSIVGMLENSSKKYKVLCFRANNAHAPNLPDYTASEGIVARFPVFSKDTIETHLGGCVANPQFIHHFSDNWLGYWLAQEGEPATECDLYIRTAISSSDVGNDEKDEETFKNLVNRYRLGRIPYNFSNEMDVSRFLYPKTFESRGNQFTFYDDRTHGDVVFVQDKVSKSHQGVIRGFHGDNKTWKLITCLHGTIRLIVYDIDSDEKQDYILGGDDTTHQTVLVPPRFLNAHQCLSSTCIFLYKWSEYYEGAQQQWSVHYNDTDIDPKWNLEIGGVVSQRDSGAGSLHELQKQVCK